MKYILFFILFSRTLLSQETYFNKNYDIENGNQIPKAICVSEDSFHILLNSRTNNTENKYVVWEVDELGNSLNINTYGVSGHNYLEGSLVEKNGIFFIFLSELDSLTTTDGDFYLASIDKEGNELWSHTYKAELSLDGSRKLTATRDGGFILTGFTQDFPAEPAQAFIIKTDSLGNMEWQKDYGESNNREQGKEVVQTEDGGYLVMGWTSIQNSNRDIWLFKIDSLGNMLWDKKYGSFYFEECKDILEVEDGYVLVGYQYQSPMLNEGSRGYILKIDKEGNLLWEKTYTGVSEYYGTRLDDAFWEVRELEDGNLAVIGNSRNYNELERFSGILMKLTAEGDSLWTKVYSNSISTHQFWDFEVTEDNGFVICGFTTGVESGTQDGWVLKVDSLGNTCQPANCDSIFTTSIQYEVTTHFPTQFYPNPAQNRVTFEHRLPKNAILEVYSLQGILIREEQVTGHGSALELDIEGWESGLYIYKVSIEGEEVSSGKLVVE